MSKLAKALTAAAGNAGESLYVEDVFSTYLYTGTGSDVTITNGIDLAGEGGMVWVKDRSVARNHQLTCSEFNVAAGELLFTNTTDSLNTRTDRFKSFNSNGFTVGNGTGTGTTGEDYASWTFRKAEKFFDVVTYTGGSTQPETYNHSLGSSPGMIIFKKTSGTGDWWVWHRSAGGIGYAANLNTTGSFFNAGTVVTAVSDTTFSVDYTVNGNGDTYVAYLFAHDAGGFGDDGSESIIKCGSFAETGSDVEVNLGFEPQWLMIKRTDSLSHWFMYDTMRGFTWVDGSNAYLQANTANAEDTQNAYFKPTATGFIASPFAGSGANWIYIAIRRPMKTPESGTEVFKPSFRITGDPTVDTGFVTDMGIVATRTGGGTSDYHLIGSRLTGNLGMTTTSTSAEVTRGLEPLKWDYNNGWGGSDTASSFAVWYSFKRATGFFDVVAYTGTGVATSFNHNLGVIPQLQIIKRRDSTSAWYVNAYDLSPTSRGFLNLANNFATSGTEWSGSDATTFSVYSGGLANINVSGATYINYLFASVAGVSKVGSYTGTGADLNVDCGFSAGARFILIKRSDSTGDWYVWDSARGIVAGNDPYLLLNSTAAEVTTTDYIDPLASGFTVTSTAPAALNASGGTYIFLAIA